MWILAMVMAIAAMGASVVRLRKVRGAVSFDLDALSRALGRSADAERLAALREEMKSEGESWESELVGVALEAHAPEERAALVNEVLIDVQAALFWGGWIPLASARLAVLGPFCVLFYGLATDSAQLSELAGWVSALGEVLPVVAWAGVGVMVSLATGREADRVAAEVRSGIDAWVARVVEAAGSGRGAEAKGE